MSRGSVARIVLAVSGAAIGGAHVELLSHSSDIVVGNVEASRQHR